MKVGEVEGEGWGKVGRWKVREVEGEGWGKVRGGR